MIYCYVGVTARVIESMTVYLRRKVVDSICAGICLSFWCPSLSWITGSSSHASLITILSNSHFLHIFNYYSEITTKLTIIITEQQVQTITELNFNVRSCVCVKIYKYLVTLTHVSDLTWNSWKLKKISMNHSMTNFTSSQHINFTSLSQCFLSKLGVSGKWSDLYPSWQRPLIDLF